MNTNKEIEKKVNSKEQKLAKSILANQVALNANEDLMFSVPKFYKMGIKNKYKAYLEELKKSEGLYDRLFTTIEDRTCDVYDIIDEYFTTASKVEIHEMENVSAVIEAYLLDPKSMEGITNKILKHKGN